MKGGGGRWEGPLVASALGFMLLTIGMTLARSLLRSTPLAIGLVPIAGIDVEDDAAEGAGLTGNVRSEVVRPKLG